MTTSRERPAMTQAPGYGYGHPSPQPYDQPYDQPHHQQPGMPGWSKVLIGGVVGMAGGLIVLVAVLVVMGSTAASRDTELDGKMAFALCVLVPTLLPTPMLLFRATRTWAVGLVIGACLSSLVLAGAGAYVIRGLTEGSP